MRRSICPALCIAAILTFLFGPDAIHAAHRLATDDAQRLANKQLYQQVERQQSDPSTPPAERQRLLAQQRALFYWFHARG